MPAAPADRVRIERDLFLRLLEIGAADDLRPFLDEALALVLGATGARRGYLELFGDDGRRGEARLWVARGFEDAEVEDVRAETSRGIVAAAVAEGRTVSTASAVEDPRFLGQRSVQAARIRAVLCAPIGAPAIGVVYLQERDGPGPFSEDDRATAELCARHLAPLADRMLLRDAQGRAADRTAELRARLEVEDIAGTSAALGDVFRQVLVAAPVPISVLVTGESGTGKTAVARALHRSSPRAAGPFVELNCAAIPETLFESELFGAEKGAHSTATRRLEGKIDAARGGTLLLDEIGEMPLATQGKLLGFLQNRRFYRLGGTQPVEADVRVVAATNRDLAELVAAKRFREDLYWRLDVLRIHMPPLRDRPEDVGPIAESVVRALGDRHGRRMALSRAARVALAEAEWPGNVRQIENALQRAWAVALSEGAAAIEPRHVFPARPGGGEGPGAAPTYEEAMREQQARFLRDALEASGWNVTETARRIGLSRSHLNDLIRAHGLERPARPAG